MIHSGKDQVSKIVLIFGVLSIWLLVIFLYHRILTAYFVGEDYEWWARVRDLDFFGSFRLFLPPNVGGIVLPPYFRPLAGWTVWLDTVPLKMTPFAFHVTSLLFHLANTALIGVLGFHLFKKNVVGTFLAILFFATFPFHPEAVTWSVGGRYDVVMTTFYLTGLLTVIKYLQTKRSLWACLTLPPFFLALLSKESAISFPLAVFVLVAFYSKLKAKIIWQYRHLFLSLILISLLYLLLRTLALGTINPYILTGHLNFFYLSTIFRFYLEFLLGVILFYFWLKRAKSTMFAPTGLLWLLFLLLGVTMLPTANLPTQERQLYLPSVFGALLLSGGCIVVWEWLQKRGALKKVFLILIFTVLVISGTSLFKKNENWRRSGFFAFKIAGELSLKFNKIPEEETVYLINIPDNLDGAYIYRTHLKEAIQFRTGRDELPKIIMAPLINGLKAKVAITGKKRVLAESDGGFVFFWATQDNLGRTMIKADYYDATLVPGQKLIIDFLENNFDTQKDMIYVFQDGEIRSLHNE